MITVHRLNGQPFVVNAFHIVSIERTPDTLLTLFSGDKMLVLDRCEDIITRIEAFVGHIGVCALSPSSADKDA
jgi:flagellar protein FlbD